MVQLQNNAKLGYNNNILATRGLLKYLIGLLLIAVCSSTFGGVAQAASAERECILYLMVGETISNNFSLDYTKPGNCSNAHGTARDPFADGTLYITLDSAAEAQSVGNELLNDEVILSYTTPFSGIDMPEVIRIYFDEDSWSLELMTYYLQWYYPGKTIDRIPVFSASNFVNDELAAQQWYLKYIGFNGAHNYCGPTVRDVSVAVIDNGFDVTHPDLVDAITKQIDAAHNDGNAQVTQRGEGFNHGTMSAGLVGATTNNNIGIASPADNKIDLIVVKASSDQARGSDIDHGLEAFAKAIEEDVDIMSVSWGAFGADFPIFRKIIQKALDKGIIIVASAGNYTSSEPFYPAAYEGVIAVASVDKQGRRSWFTNYGPWVDIAAPGEDIMATDLGGGYTKSEGTSQAAPIVAGAIAFGLAQGMTLEDIWSKLEPVVDEGIGDGIISMREYCACEISYPQLDYNSDGELNDQDLNFIRSQYLGDLYLDECEGKRYGSVCCPPGSFCDLDISGGVDQQDAIYWLWVRLGYIDFDICGDGLDNDCDGEVDDPRICGGI